MPLPLALPGTMESTEADAHLVTAGVCAAVRAGYRALDLAEHYGAREDYAPDPPPLWPPPLYPADRLSN